jgi:hypothetical protein
VRDDSFALPPVAAKRAERSEERVVNKETTMSVRCLQTVALLALLPVTTARAQLPAARLDGVFPAGCNAGKTFDLTIAGADLDDVDRLHFTHGGITAQRKMGPPGPFDDGPQPVPNQFVVTVAGDVPPGLYEVRAQGKYGVSNPRVIEVGTLAEVNEAEGNNTPGQPNDVALPVVVNGQINGGADVDCVRFTAKAGERVLIVCDTRRIDSPLDVVLTVFDAGERTLGESAVGSVGAALVDFAAPADGAYVVRVTDALYRGGAQYTYRLIVGALPHIDFVFPPAGQPGTTAQITLFGRNLRGGQPSGLTVDGRPLEKLAVGVALPGNPLEAVLAGVRLEPQQAGLDALEYRVGAPQGASNASLVGFATAPVMLEQEANNTPETAQKLVPPCEVAGQFHPLRDRDWYTFSAKQGDVFAVEVLSHRLGLPTDPSLVVQQVTKNEAGQEQTTLLARVDDVGNRDGGYEFDARTGDPVYRFVAPAEGTYRLLVQDGYSSLKSDPRLVYRLAVRREQPDFRLAAVPADSSGALLLRKGGRAALRVVAFRRDGFAEPIRVSASGLPQGVTSTEVVIGPASNAATLVVTAADGAAAAVGQVQVVGKALVGGQEATRVARCGGALVPPPQMMQPGQVMPGIRARVTGSIMVAVSELEVAPVSLAAGQDQVIETARGAVVKVPYTVVRRNEYKGGLTAFPTDLPPNTNPQQFGIGDQGSGEFQVNLTSNTPAGTYTFHVNAFAQGVPYKRNPEAAQAAAERKAKFDKIAPETAEAMKAATDAAQKARQALDEAAAQLKAAGDKKAASDKLATETAAAAKTTADAAAQAKKAAADNANDANLQAAAGNAEKAAAEAALKAKTAADELAAAQKALEESQAKAKTSGEGKAVADKTAQEATSRAQLAQQLKQQADQRAQQLANEAQQRNVNYWTPSTPVTIKIAEFPVTFEGPPAQATVKQGASLELPVKVTRLYGFDQPVNVQVVLPGGVGGIGVQNIQVAQGQADGKLAFAAQPNATVGTHNVTVRVQMNWNGQNLQFDRPLALTVEAP